MGNGTGSGRPGEAQPAGIVLAGGRGSRMEGADKPFVRLAGRTLFDRVASRFRRQVDPLVISANGEPGRFRAYAVPVVADQISDSGPLGGILAGLRHLAAHRPGARHLATVATDTPFLPLRLVQTLSEALEPDARMITLARSVSGRHPVTGLWPVALADDLERFLRSDVKPKVSAFVEQNPHRYVWFDEIILPDGAAVDPFVNVNTPLDVERAESAARALDLIEKDEMVLG